MRAAVFGLYRVRVPMYYGAAVILIANVVVLNVVLPEPVLAVWRVLLIAALAAMLCAALLSYLVPRWLPARPTRAVTPPISGRWIALNSPATKTPSHGVRAYGQTYAIDLVADPTGTARPEFGGPAMRAATSYPAFGEPVFAMLDGTVVRASNWRRDHRARSNAAGFIYLMMEGMIRQLGGPGFIVGNHVTIRNDDGTYATVAHLRQGSVAVRAGDRITAGTKIGECGNSGNSSEPHVHAQLMDRASFWTAEGLPMAFAGITLGEDPTQVTALPADGQHMIAAEGKGHP